MPYNFAADSFHTKKLSSGKVYFLNENRPFCVFEAPFGGLRGNVRRSSYRLIGKRVVDFLLALIELFFARCYGWGVTSVIGWKSAITLQRGSVDPKFQVEGVAPHQPFFFSEN